MDALILLVLLFTLGIVGGRLTAKRHVRELDAREAELRDMFVTSLKSLPGARPDGGAALVTGEVTIASDYLKTFLSGLRTLVGGEIFKISYRRHTMPSCSVAVLIAREIISFWSGGGAAKVEKHAAAREERETGHKSVPVPAASESNPRV